ncbi:MAG: hypothetical protein V1911_01210 [Candidatus Micrarchaeota archaeon]
MKGQASVDMLLSIGIVFVIATLFTAAVVIPKSAENAGLAKKLSAKTVCEQLSGAISSAQYSGEGFFSSLELPASLSNFKPYSLSFYSNYIIVSWDESHYSCGFRSEVEYLGLNPPFSLNKTALNFSNANGVVIIE